VEAERPEVALGRGPDGSWDWSPPGKGGGARELRLDLLRVREGRLLLEDQVVPVQGELRELELRLQWTAGPGEYRGRLEVGRLVLRAPGEALLEVGASVVFRLRDGSLELDSALLEGEALRLEGQGRVELLEGPAYRLELEGEAAAGPLAVLLAPEGQRPEGTLRLELRLEGRGPDYLAEGRIGARRLRHPRLEIRDLSASLSARPGSLRAEDLRARALGGGLQGDLALEGEGEHRRARLRLGAEGLSLRALLAILGEERLPFGGSLDLEGVLDWSPGEGPRAAGSLALRAEARAGDPALWEPEAKGRFDWSGSRLIVEVPELRLAELEGSTLVELRPGPELRAEFSASGGDLREAGDLAAALATAGLFRAPRTLHPATLSGEGRVEGTLTWSGPRTLRLLADLDLDRVGLDGHAWGQVTGRVGLGPEGTRLEQLEARGGVGDLCLDGRIGRPGAPGLELVVEASDWPLEALLDMAGLEVLPLTGRGDLQVELEGEPGRSLAGHAGFRLGEGTFYRVGFDGLEGELVFRPSGLSLERVVATLGEGRLEARGELPPRGLAGGEISFTARQVPLQALLPASGPLAPAGSIGGRGRVRFEAPEGMRIEAELRGEGLAVGSFLLGALDLELESDARRARLRGAALGGGLGLEGTVDLEGEGRPLDLRLVLQQVELIGLVPEWSARFPGVVPELSVDGRLHVQGPLASPEQLRVEGLLEQVRLDAGYASARSRGTAPVLWESGLFDVGRLTMENEAGTAILDLSLEPGPRPTISAGLEGSADLRLLDAFFPDLSASGSVSVDLRLEGSLDDPALWGEAEIHRGRFRISGFPQALDAVEARLRLVDSVAQVRSLEASVGGGRLRGEGEAVLEGLGVDSYEFSLRAEAVLLRYPRGFRGQYDADLEIAGDTTQALLSGEIRMIRGLYSRDLKIEEKMFAGRVREFEGAALPGFGSSLWLDLRVEAPDNLWVRNDMGDLEARAELEVGGSLARPEVTGRVQAFPGGRFRFRNVDYELEQGDLSLGGRRQEQPRFDLRAHTDVRDYEIVLAAEGTLERFDYELTSRPPLSDQDIVSLLVTGQTLEEIAGPTRQTPRGDLAAAYFGGAVGQALFGGMAQNLLGLDRFEIRPSAIGASGKPTTRITLGKRVTDDVLFLYSRDISAQEDDIYQMEYALGRSLRLFAEQSGQGTYGGDLRYTYHHGARKQARRLAEEGREIGSIRRVVLEAEGDLDTEDLRRRLKLKEGRPLTRAALTEAEERLRLVLARRGYLQASVGSRVEPEEGGAAVVFEIEAGRRYELVFENAEKESDDLRGHLAPIWAESLFSADVVEDARLAVQEYFRRRGHFNAYVGLGKRDPERSGTIRFLVDRGPLVKVSEVRIVGNEAIPDERIRRSLLTQASSLGSQIARAFWKSKRGLLVPGVLQEDAAAVTRLYRESGFLEARVEVVPLLQTEGSEAIVVVSIEEGEPARVARLEVLGLEALRPEHRKRRELRRALDLPEDRILTRSLPLALERAAVRWMDTRGYPDARARATLHAVEEGVQLDLELLPGSYQVVGPVRIEGNRTTKEKVIRRELVLEEGRPLTRADLLESQHRLYRTGLFVSVRLEPQSPSGEEPPELRPILVRVQEGPRFTSLYGVGYDTEEGPRVTLGLTDGNFLGRDHVASGQIRYGSLEQRAVLTWEQPRFFGTRLESLVSAFGLVEKRETFRLRRVGTTAQLTKRHRPELTSFLTYQLDQTRVTDLEISLEEFFEEEPRLDPIRLGSLGYALALDERDNPFSSRKGLFVSAEARLFAQPLASERDFWKMSAQGSWFQPAGPFILATGLRLGAANTFAETEVVPIAERYFAGGASTIRGFERDTVGPTDPITGQPLGGEGLLIFNQEARFPIWKTFHGALFFDAGNVYLRLEDYDLTDLRYTAGLSLRLGTPVGPLRVGYGFKLDRRPGESAGEWYLALGQAF
jgi:outer membrane protein assembly complex protein YaeT